MIKARSFLFLATCGTAAVVSTVLFGTTSDAQQNPAQQVSTAVRQFGMAKKLYEDLQNPFNALLRQLKNAKTVEQKSQTKKAIQAALVEYFNADMKLRRAELDRLTSRSDKMSAALKKRAAAKEQLVDLQLKSFQYEADGLGLFSTQGANSRKASTPPSSENQFPPGRSSGSFGGGGGFAAPSPLEAAMNNVNEARQKVRSAKSGENRTQAMTELSKAFSLYFDVDLKAREQEMDTINAGLIKMQTGLKKRTNAKDDIVDLQLQIIVNEAEGLGFFRKAALNSDSNLPDRGLPGKMEPAGAANPPGTGGFGGGFGSSTSKRKKAADEFRPTKR